MGAYPWIDSGGPQRTAMDLGIHDLYKSGNVFINGVQVALYAEPTDTGGPGSAMVGGAIVFDNTPAGVKSALTNMNATDPALANEEEVGDTSGSVPAVVPPNGCSKSKYYKLSDAKHAIVPQLGLSKAQIECNWITLCANVLDRLKDAGYYFTINSGFRSLAFNNATKNASKTSDHLIGCAADITCGSMAANKKMFKYLVKNIDTFNLSQVILERTWVHVAFNGKGPKNSYRTAWTYSGSPPYGAGGSHGQTLPSDLKPV